MSKLRDQIKKDIEDTFMYTLDIDLEKDIPQLTNTVFYDFQIYLRDLIDIHEVLFASKQCADEFKAIVEGL